MRRDRRSFEQSIPPDALAHLRRHGSMLGSGLIVRIRGRRVVAHYPAERYWLPPRFSGRCTRGPAGAVVRGHITASRRGSALTTIFWALSALVLCIGVIAAVSAVGGESGAWIPASVCLIGGAGLAVSNYLGHSADRSSFDADAERLARGLRAYLLTGRAG